MVALRNALYLKVSLYRIWYIEVLKVTFTTVISMVELSKFKLGTVQYHCGPYLTKRLTLTADATGYLYVQYIMKKQQKRE